MYLSNTIFLIYKQIKFIGVNELKPHQLRRLEFSLFVLHQIWDLTFQ